MAEGDLTEWGREDSVPPPSSPRRNGGYSPHGADPTQYTEYQEAPLNAGRVNDRPVDLAMAELPQQKCPICNFVARSREAFARHMRTGSDGKTVCEQQAERFRKEVGTESLDVEALTKAVSEGVARSLGPTLERIMGQFSVQVAGAIRDSRATPPAEPKKRGRPRKHEVRTPGVVRGAAPAPGPESKPGVERPPMPMGDPGAGPA